MTDHITKSVARSWWAAIDDCLAVGDTAWLAVGAVLIFRGQRVYGNTALPPNRLNVSSRIECDFCGRRLTRHFRVPASGSLVTYLPPGSKTRLPKPALYDPPPLPAGWRSVNGYDYCPTCAGDIP